MSRRRTCLTCGKPLGSTHKLCHECGGRTYRGKRKDVDPSPTIIPEVMAAFQRLLGRGGA